MKFTKRDYAGAKAKLAEAGLTERQLAALKDDILRESLVLAELDACKTHGKVTHEIGGTGSLTEMIGKRDSMQNSVRVAVYWFHEHHNHRIALYRALPSGESALKSADEVGHWDHTELFETVDGWLKDGHREEYIRDCIQRCHGGSLTGPIDQKNLHLFRRYRNSVTGNAQQLIDEAKEARQ